MPMPLGRLTVVCDLSLDTVLSLTVSLTHTVAKTDSAMSYDSISWKLFELQTSLLVDNANNSELLMEAKLWFQPYHFSDGIFINSLDS